MSSGAEEAGTLQTAVEEAQEDRKEGKHVKQVQVCPGRRAKEEKAESACAQAGTQEAPTRYTAVQTMAKSFLHMGNHSEDVDAVLP